jgi:pyridoxal phosphate enzyme (YggS family)
MTIAENLTRVREQIAEAATRAGRPPSEVTLVAVTKTFPVETVLAGYAAGLCDFGENRVQEAEGKIRAAQMQAPQARWHLIGHLQRNKVKTAVECFAMIHSVDSLRLAQEINKRCGAEGKRMPILIEVNVGGEASKTGYQLDAGTAAFFQEAEQICALPNLQVQGLMTIAPYAPRAEDVRPYFVRLRQLRDELASRLGRELPQLSMGMSGDFTVAIEEGATLVRIGTAIFGERMTKR